MGTKYYDPYEWDNKYVCSPVSILEMKTMVHKYPSEEGEGSTKDMLLKAGFLPEKRQKLLNFQTHFWCVFHFDCKQRSLIDMSII